MSQILQNKGIPHQHVRSHAEGVEKLACSKCNRMVSSKISMINHQNWHKGMEILRTANKRRRDREDKLKKDAKKIGARKGMRGGVKGISKSPPARQKSIWSPRRKRSDKK